MRNCIACTSSDVKEFLDLGTTALANSFLTKEELDKLEPQFPLRTGFCHACGHVQLLDTVPPQAMFTDYLYVSSASDTLKAHLYDLSDVISQRYALSASDLVVDIGCNDGTLLLGFRRHGVKVLGVDPAQNLAELYKNPEIERYVALFNSEVATNIVKSKGQAKVITATNTFPHIQDLPGFVKGIKTALAPGGVLVIEMHYLLDLLEQGAFDTVYHEHVSYWSLQPMVTLFQRLGMEVTNAERLPLHHGQLRVFVQHKGEGRVCPAVSKILQEEKDKGLGNFETYEQFADTTLEIKRNLQMTLKELKSSGNTLAGYGAPAKGNTLLGFLEIGKETIEYIVDRSPLKQGLFTPTMHVPIVATEKLLEQQPNYVLLLAWNFVDEVMEQQAEYRRRGGKFILPLPKVEVI